MADGPRHISYLLSKSRLGPGQRNEDTFATIKKLYNKLDSIPEISIVLRVLELSEVTDIIFDFNKDSVVDLDPTHSSATAGTCDYHAGRLYIGAKQDLESELLGTMAHELTHLALHICFDNQCNPYHRSDKETKSAFDQIVTKCRGKKAIDPIIERVFTVYKNPNDWPAELIVRVPHLIARYYEERSKEELIQQVRELFQFYEERTKIELECFLKNPIQCKVRHKTQRLNDMLQHVSKIENSKIRFNRDSLLNDHVIKSETVQVLSSSLPQLASVNVFQGMCRNTTLLDVTSNCIFALDNDFRNVEKASNIFDIFQSDNFPKLIIECTSAYSDSKQDMWSVIEKFNEMKRIIFIADVTVSYNIKSHPAFLDIALQSTVVRDYFWQDLTLHSQKYLLKRTVNFQGRKIVFNSIVSNNSMITRNLSLKDLMEENNLEIGTPIPISSGYNEIYYIGRTFNHNIIMKSDIFRDKTTHKFSDLLAINEEEFKRFCQSSKNNVHWVSLDPSGRLIWQISRGSLETLRQYIDTKHELSYSPKNLKNFLRQAQRRRIVIISDRAGMGKTTVLTHLSLKIKKQDFTRWVVRLDLNNYTDVLKQQPEQVTPTMAVRFLIKNLMRLQSPSLEIFEQLLEEGKVVLMLDGFDEISPSYKDAVISLIIALIQTPLQQLWITTRPNLREILEETLQQFCCTLESFSEDDQLEYLVKYWRQNLGSGIHRRSQPKVIEFARALITRLGKLIKEKHFELTGVPLQVRMLAEAFDDEVKEFCYSDQATPDLPDKLDLLEVYQRFLNRKYLVYVTEKNNPTKVNVATTDLVSILKGGMNLRKIHQQLALEVLFPQRKEALLKSKKNTLCHQRN